MEEFAFVIPPGAVFPPPKSLDIGDPVPDLGLATLAGTTMTLSDLHVDKNRPMMVMASSSS